MPDNPVFYEEDSWKASLIWGRNGAALLALVSALLQVFGFDFTTEQQSAIMQAVTAILTGLSAILAFVSKLRETKKITK